MGYKIVVKKGRKHWYAVIIAENGKIIFQTPTAQTYCSKQSCLKTCKRMAKMLRMRLEVWND